MPVADKPNTIGEELDLEQYGRQLVRETEEYLGKWAAFWAWLVKNGRT